MGMLSDIKSWLFGEAPPDPATPVMVVPVPVAVPAPRDEPAFETPQRPKIGISGSSGDSKSVAAMVTQLRSAGADPVVIVDHAERIRRYGGVEMAVAQTLEGLSGLVVLGNDRDIPPESYGEAPHPSTKSMTLNDDGTANIDGIARRTFEKLAMKQAVETDMPLLGVCAGMQGFNVDGGGTLHQHVPDLVGSSHHMQSDNKIPPFVPVQFVQIQEGTGLSAIAGSLPGLYTPQHGDLPPGVVAENSMHNQAVKDVRPDCQVTALSEDGIIEAMEMKPDSAHPRRWAQFTQFHPEFGASDLGAKLAANLTGAARDYVRSRPTLKEMAAAELAQGVPGPMAAMMLQRRQFAALGHSV